MLNPSLISILLYGSKYETFSSQMETRGNRDLLLQMVGVSEEVLRKMDSKRTFNQNQRVEIFGDI